MCRSALWCGMMYHSHQPRRACSGLVRAVCRLVPDYTARFIEINYSISLLYFQSLPRSHYSHVGFASPTSAPPLRARSLNAIPSEDEYADTSPSAMIP